MCDAVLGGLANRCGGTVATAEPESGVVVGVEALAGTEAQAPAPPKLLCSPTKRIHHARLLLPSVPTLLVPHPRLQAEERAERREAASAGRN